MKRYETQADLTEAVKHLAQAEPRFAVLHARHGVPSLRKAEASLETMLATVCEQFLSIKAAEAIWSRVRARIGQVTPKNVMAVSVEDYVALGLSRSKAKCFHACAGAGIDYGRLHEDEAHVARAKLLEIWGIGPWSADIYLMTVIGHADAFPSGDVALQAAAQHLFNKRKRPDAKALDKMGEKWRPHRAAAARLLWAHYRHVKTMPQA